MTSEKIKTFDESENEKGAFKTSKRLEHFGEKQNEYNVLLAECILELKERISRQELENEEHIRLQKLDHEEHIRNLENTYKESTRRLEEDHEHKLNLCAKEIMALKTEIDRLKLTSKLNTNTIDRLVKNIDTLQSDKSELNCSNR